MGLSLRIPNSERSVYAAELGPVIDLYIADRREEITPKAIDNYQRVLRPFVEWWSEHPDDHQYTISKTNLRRFIDWMEEEYRTSYNKQASAYHVAKTLAVLKRVFIWAHKQGCIEQDISDLVPQHHDPGRPKYFPTIAELERLLAAPVGQNRIRDTALMAFMLSTAARRFEVQNALIENITFNTPIDRLSLADDHGGYIHLTVVKGNRGGRDPGRYSVFCGKAGLALKLWLSVSGWTSGSIFGLKSSGIRLAVLHSAMRCDLREPHPHAFRRAFIDYWLRNRDEGDAADIARCLQVGHKLTMKSESTGYYFSRDNWRANLELIRKFHISPLAEITIDWKVLFPGLS